MSQHRTRLGEESIKKLLMNLSLPAAVAMMVNGLYNAVDAIFIGNGVGELAIGGLAIAFPIQMLILAFGQMVGIGAGSVVSRNLGANNVEAAEKATGNAFVSIFVLSILFAIFGWFFTDPLLYLFGTTENILPYARDYIKVIFLGSVFFAFAVTSNNLIRAEGKAKIAMISMIIGAGCNIILDPIFIFVFDMGIRGAAIATIISQFISFLFIIYYIYSGKSALKVQPHHLVPDKKVIGDIFSVGASAFARNSTNSFFSLVVNNSLRIYGGDAAIAIFGIINRIIAFLFMPILGVVQGMQPIAGFNYGAKKLDRVREVLKLSIIISTLLAIGGWFIGLLFPRLIISAFAKDPELIKEGVFVFRIIIAMVPLMGFQLVGATLFQSIGKGRPALILSLLRQVILLIPLILILPRLFDLKLMGIWIAFPISDLLAGIISVWVLKRQMHLITESAQV